MELFMLRVSVLPTFSIVLRTNLYIPTIGAILSAVWLITRRHSYEMVRVSGRAYRRCYSHRVYDLNYFYIIHVHLINVQNHYSGGIILFFANILSSFSAECRTCPCDKYYFCPRVIKCASGITYKISCNNN